MTQKTTRFSNLVERKHAIQGGFKGSPASSSSFTDAAEKLEKGFKENSINETTFVKSMETLESLKGSKPVEVGETRNWGGVNFEKTADGWVKNAD